MAIRKSDSVQEKLKNKHNVYDVELQQCFENRTGELLKDPREDHQSDPPTLWFIAPTNKRRLLKVCFIQRGQDQHIRTAYQANEEELRIYRKYGNPSDF